MISSEIVESRPAGEAGIGTPWPVRWPVQHGVAHREVFMTILRQLAEEWAASEEVRLHDVAFKDAVKTHEGFGLSLLAMVEHYLKKHASEESDDSPLRWAMHEALRVVRTLY